MRSGISSGARALFGASVLIVRLTCVIVIWRFVGTGSGLLVFEMSLSSANGGDGKKVLLSVSIFCELVAAWPSGGRIYVLVGYSCLADTRSGEASS
jgi:hypothetical protein